MASTNGTGTHPGMAAPAPNGGDDLPRFLVIEIDPPVEWNGNTYAELRLEEPSGEMIRKSEQVLVPPITYVTLRDHQFALVSNCSGVPVQAIVKMRISQIQKAADFLAGFMPGGLPTGAI